MHKSHITSAILIILEGHWKTGKPKQCHTDSALIIWGYQKSLISVPTHAQIREMWDMIVLTITVNLSEHSNTTCKLTLFLLFLTWTATLTDWLVRGVLSQLLVFCFLLGEYIIKSWIYSAWEKLVFSVRFASVPETERSAESSVTAH